MHLLTTPLSQVEREAAKTAALTAMREKLHVGIRPARDIARKQTAGVKLHAFTQIDDDIQTARELWPKEKKFSVFGADAYTSNIGVVINSDMPWIIDGVSGDGCFDGATDYGYFSCDPEAYLNAPDSGIAMAPDNEDLTPPEGQS